LIEWPEQGEGFLPAADVSISIGDSEVGRRVTLNAYSQVGQQLVHQLAISGV
jgi:tRNA threonylcarbamoyladenosine biosynthesis protein TsaE